MIGAEPIHRRGRQAGVQVHRWAALAAFVLALGVGAVPIERVAACSCMPMTTEEAIRSAEVAVVGTVVDAQPLGVDPNMGGETVAYLVNVERATGATDSKVQVISSGNGAMCGMSFGVEERWLIAAYGGSNGLETNLCSGNQPVDGLSGEDQAVVAELLTYEPEAAPEPGPGQEAAGSLPMLPIAATALAVLTGLGLGYLVMRREAS